MSDLPGFAKIEATQEQLTKITTLRDAIAREYSILEPRLGDYLLVTKNPWWKSDKYEADMRALTMDYKHLPKWLEFRVYDFGHGYRLYCESSYKLRALRQIADLLAASRTIFLTPTQSLIFSEVTANG